MENNPSPENQETQVEKLSREHYLEQEKKHTLTALGTVGVGGASAGNTYFLSELYQVNPKAALVVAAGATVLASVEGYWAYDAYKKGLRAE